MRKAFVKACSSMLSKTPNSVVLLGDIGVHSFSHLANEYPNRVINLGIMEQSMMGVAAGMSSKGIVPTVHSIAPFLIERALEQIKIDFGYQKLAGNLVSVGASFDYASLGCTHHCPADVPTLSNVPDVDIYIPGHPDEFSFQFEQQWDSGALNYFRLSESSNSDAYNLKRGEVRRIKSGTQAIVIAVGPILQQVVEATATLDIELHYVNSIPKNTELSILTKLRGVPVITIEPYYPGSLLQRIVQQISSLNLKPSTLGVNVEFSRLYGKYEDHLNKHELDAFSIHKRIDRLL